MSGNWIHVLPWSGGSRGEERKLFLDEINLMKRISDGSNPHVLKMLGCVTTTLPMMLIMQFVPHGSLKEYLRAMKSNVDNVTNKVATFTALYSCTCHVCIYIHINITPCIHTRDTQVTSPPVEQGLRTMQCMHV